MCLIVFSESNYCGFHYDYLYRDVDVCCWSRAQKNYHISVFNIFYGRIRMELVENVSGKNNTRCVSFVMQITRVIFKI